MNTPQNQHKHTLDHNTDQPDHHADQQNPTSPDPSDLYTKSGDDGHTSLACGRRIGKDDLRIDALGTIDELNSALALAKCASTLHEITKIITTIQNTLFDLGTDLSMCAQPQHVDIIARINQRHIHQLESLIDSLCAKTPQLNSFIIPGGSELSARLHLARAICRRAERIVVLLQHKHDQHIPSTAIPYINRLSDLLFALARRANQLADIPDTPWSPTTND